MKKFLTIITKVNEPEFIENLVEQLAHSHTDMGYGSYKKIGEWQPVETSTTDMYAGGTIEMSMNNEQLNLSYIAKFLFTCLKKKDGAYKLEWSSSLS